MDKKIITNVFMFIDALTKHIHCRISKSSFLVLVMCLFFQAQPLANEGPSEAEVALLEISANGFQNSLEILNELASRDDPEALLELSDIYGDGHFVPFDPVSLNFSSREQL